jgi:hypothetical protein
MYNDVPVIAGSHHENIDGTGYPNGLKGEDIPLGSKIISVADFFEAITSKRHYREPMPDEVAYRLLRSHSNTRFDPEIVESFIRFHKRTYGREGFNGPGGFGNGGTDERRLKRVPCKTDVSVRFNSHSTIGTTEDISERGMFIGVPDPIQQGTVVHIVFNLPGSSTPPVEAYAKIVWTNTEGEKTKPDFPQGNGLQFTQIPDSQEKLLQDFIYSSEVPDIMH